MTRRKKVRLMKLKKRTDPKFQSSEISRINPSKWVFTTDKKESFIAFFSSVARGEKITGWHYEFFPVSAHRKTFYKSLHFFLLLCPRKCETERAQEFVPGAGFFLTFPSPNSWFQKPSFLWLSPPPSFLYEDSPLLLSKMNNYFLSTFFHFSFCLISYGAFLR